jgi:hypothetical protein
VSTEIDDFTRDRITRKAAPGTLCDLVWDSRLSRTTKHVALALAYCADVTDRTDPPVSTLMHLTGGCDRHVRAQLSELCRLGVIVPETPRTGEYGATVYRMNRARLIAIVG